MTIKEAEGVVEKLASIEHLSQDIRQFVRQCLMETDPSPTVEVYRELVTLIPVYARPQRRNLHEKKLVDA